MPSTCPVAAEADDIDSAVPATSEPCLAALLTEQNRSAGQSVYHSSERTVQISADWQAGRYSRNTLKTSRLVAEQSSSA